MIEATRRGFLVGLSTGIALLAAPAIVRASSLMPVVKIPKPRRIVSRHSVSILRSEIVLEVQIDGRVVDYEMTGPGWTIQAKAANGAVITAPIPPMGARDTNIMAGVRWQ